MLKQEINLAKAYSKPQSQKYTLTWKSFIWSQLAYLIGALFISILLALQLNHQKTVLLQQDQEIKVLQEKLLLMQNYLPMMIYQKNHVQAGIQQESSRLLDQKVFQTVFNNRLISHCLKSLAEVVAPNVWLNSILVTNNGLDIILKGSSINAVSMQDYFKKITSNGFFISYTPNLKNIESVENQNRLQNEYNFEINLAKKL